jgi:putative transposase
MRSYSCLWTHAVFGTKKREPLILPAHEIKIHQHLFEQLKKQGCIPIVINGMADHIHMLFAANYKKSLMEVMRDVKGETSFWANKNHILPHRLEWQDSFYVASVSEKAIPATTTYILNQKQHHQTKTLDDELTRMESTFLPQYS